MPFQTKYMYASKLYKIYIFKRTLVTLHKVNGMFCVNNNDTEIC